MLSKEDFIYYIDIIKKHRERENKFLECLDFLSPETSNETFLYGDYESALVDLLMLLMEDEGEIIPLFIYDTEFGTNNAFSTLFVENDSVDLSSAEKVYDYILSRKEKKNAKR